MHALGDSWSRAWTGCGARGDGTAVRDGLLEAYREPQRRYHTLQHLSECLALFDDFAALAAHPGEVEIGLWFHDAVYDVRGSSNEEQSARWASTALADAGVLAPAVRRVYSLIMATRHTVAADAPDEELLVDIDLSILAAPAERFGEYERQIRAEYGFVPDELFQSKRRAILESFLDRDRIYRTPALFALLESRARTNLAASIAAIGF